MNKLKYFTRSSLKRALRTAAACPSCGYIASSTVSRKYFVTSLQRCDSCNLLFRSPTDSVDEACAYYQSEYTSGITTETPSDDELQVFKDNNFKGTGKNFSRYLKILHALRVEPPSSIIDYGCSWGYGTWQLGQAKYNAFGYELSRPRAKFARTKLDITVSDRIEDLPMEVDVVFSTHVLEHIANLDSTIKAIRSRLRPGGLFFAITPNGSDAYRRNHYQSWIRSWGLKHPLLLDDTYWKKYFGSTDYLITSDFSDVALLSEWASRPEKTIGDLNGPELLVIAKN